MRDIDDPEGCVTPASEKNMLLTVMLASNLAGCLLKPFILHPTTGHEGQGSISLLQESLRHKNNVVMTTTAKGYMTMASFRLWLNHLRREVQHREKIILLVDNHCSHTSATVQAYARSLNIVMVYLPPNTTHALQPMDQYNQRFNFFRTLAYRRLTAGTVTRMSQELGIEVVLSALDDLARGRHSEVIAAWRACGITAQGFDVKKLRQAPRNDQPENRQLSLESVASDLGISSQDPQPVTPRSSVKILRKYQRLQRSVDDSKVRMKLAFQRQLAQATAETQARQEAVKLSRAKNCE